MHLDNLKSFAQGGMDQDSSPNYVAPMDWISAFNVRITGTSEGEAGVITNIDSNDLVPGTRSAGINHCIGAQGFESIRKAIGFIYNSGGYHQIVQYDLDTDTQTTLYTDKTDSGGASLLNLDPQYYVQIKLVNDIYLVWTDGKNPVGFTNLNTLTAGGYSVVTAEDFSLIKPQGLLPITGNYSDDAGKAANFVKGNLFQFNYQYVSEDFTYSAWSTWSKRLIPAIESTPTAGSDVRVNNCIVLYVSVGSERVLTINIAGRSADLDFGIIKSVDRAYAIALPHTAVDIPNEIYEAYDPATGLYSFVFYNDSVSLPVPATQTDEPYDTVPKAATAVEIINGNIIGLGDLFEGYDRAVLDVNVASSGYDPNLTVPTVPSMDEPFVITESFPGASGSGAGDHKRRMYVGYRGVPHTNDVLTIVLADIRDANNTLTYTYTVPSSQNGNLNAVISTFATIVPNSSLQFNPDGSVYIFFVGPPYFGMISQSITIYNSGPSQSKSIHALLDNSSYQLAIRCRDIYGRYFPLITGNQYIVKTQSFAQLNGNTPQINLQINTTTAPTDAVDYQIMITPNSTVNSMLDVLGNFIDYKGSWDAHANTPALAANSGTVGDAYQITAPSIPTDNRNLGNGNVDFNTGDYVVYNGKSWDVVSKNFADLTGAANTWVFKINPLNLFNQQYADAGVSTVLSYSYTPGDRFTLHYYLTGTTPTYVNAPCVDLQVLGYDSSTFLVKLEKSATFSSSTIAGKNCYFRLYSPKKSSNGTSSVQNETVWYEIGERYTITNGQFDTTNITITDGDVYFKTRSYNGAVDPNVVYAGLATDFNFSDFYVSSYTSYGRPGTYNDVLETTERKACIRYSQEYVLGSKYNGLTKFYAANIYGDADGQTSSSSGPIQVMWQRGNILIVFQATNIGYVPVNISIIEDNIQQQQIAISEKLLNTVRYSPGDIGIGSAKESFCYYNDSAYFVDPNRCEPCHATTGGVFAISGKMSKFFKTVLQSAFDNHQKVTSYYDRFNNEFVLTVQTANQVVINFAFNALNWQVLDGYAIVPSDVTATPNGAHCTVSYNNTTGIAIYTPTTDYVGNDVATFTFDTADGPVTKNVCLNWIAGSTDINPFVFADLTNQLLNTEIESNSVLISGNTIPAPISITGGEYSINGGSYTSSSGTVNSGDTVVVRQLSSSMPGTPMDATLTVGSYSDTFSVTTKRQVQINWQLAEQTSPFVDGNLTVTDNGNAVSPFPVVSSGTGISYVLEDDTIAVSAYTELTNTGTNSKLHLNIKKDGVEIFDQTIDNNPPPNVSIDTTFISEYGSVYDILVNTYSDADYYSAEIDAAYRKNDCAPGQTGSYVHVFLAAGAYTSAISQADADNQAQTAAQAQANSEGTCITDTFYSTLLVDYTTDTTADLCAFVVTAGLDETNVIVTGTAESPSGPLLLPNDGTDPANCLMLSSDKLGSTSPAWRFGMNLAAFQAKYPALTSIKFRIQGRDISATSASFRYAPRAVSEGYFTMGGSPGSMIPGVSGAATSPTTVTSTLISGADGTVGIGVGSPALDLEYTFATNALVVTTY